MDSFWETNCSTNVRAKIACALSASSGQSPAISPASTAGR